MSITESAEYRRGLAVCDEHHPLRVNASGVGIRTMTKADMLVIIGQQAREIEALREAAGAVVDLALSTPTDRQYMGMPVDVGVAVKGLDAALAATEPQGGG